MDYLNILNWQGLRLLVKLLGKTSLVTIFIFSVELKAKEICYLRISKIVDRSRILQANNKYELREVSPGIFIFLYREKNEMVDAFLRFQEHYESPRYKGRVFSQSDFKNWYQYTYQRWDYVENAIAFNIPSHSLSSFMRGAFEDLSKKESSILELFRNRFNDGKKFYLIATQNNGRDHTRQLMINLKHEIAHALYSLNPAYKAEVMAILKSHKKPLQELSNYLRGPGGYHQDVLLDEIHAYLITDPKDSFKERRIDFKPLSSISKKLEIVFTKYFRDNLEILDQ